MFIGSTTLMDHYILPFEGFAFNIAIRLIGTITAVKPTDIAIKSASISSIISPTKGFPYLGHVRSSIHDNLLSF